MQLVQLLLAVGIGGVMIGAATFILWMRLMPPKPFILPIDPDGAPSVMRRGVFKGKSLYTTIRGKETVVPIDEPGIPYRGSTLWVVNARNGLPWKFRHPDAPIFPDGFRIASEARSLNQEAIQRERPEGFLGALERMAPALLLVILVMVGAILFGVGKFAGWW